MKHTYKILLSAVLILTLLASSTALATGDLIIGGDLFPGNNSSPTSVTVDIDATKLLDGQDPGERKFTFKVWKLTPEQLLTVFPELLPEESVPPEAIDPIPPIPIDPNPGTAKASRDALIGVYNPYKLFIPSFTAEESATILPSVRKALEQYPYITVRNDGKNIPVHHETFNRDELPVPFNATYYTVIAEVEEKGNGICEDTAICICGWSVNHLRSLVPIPGGGGPTIEAPYPDMGFGNNSYEEREVFEYSRFYFARLSTEDGFISLKSPFDAEGEIQPEDVLVFRNKTCPNADPGDLPATGDNMPMLLLTATALMALAAIIALRRRA